MDPSRGPGDGLVSFVYLLARESLVVAEIERLVINAERHSAHPEIEFSSPDIAAWARTIAARLLA